MTPNRCYYSYSDGEKRDVIHYAKVTVISGLAAPVRTVKPMLYRASKIRVTGAVGAAAPCIYEKITVPEAAVLSKTCMVAVAAVPLEIVIE